MKITKKITNRLNNSVLVHYNYIRKIVEIRQKKAKYYIIKRGLSGAGIFSNYITYISHIDFCLKNNLIPVVDMKTYYCSLYHESLSDVNAVNIWEYYFQQPMDCALDEVVIERSVYSSGDFVGNNYVSHKNSKSIKKLGRWCSLSSNYMRFNKKTQKHVESELDNLGLCDKRVLGVSYRAGYDLLQSVGHEAQVPIDKLVYNIKRHMDVWSCDYVFIAVESQDVIDFFAREFGDRLIYLDRPRVGGDTPTCTLDKDRAQLYLSSLKSAQVGGGDSLSELIDFIKFERDDDMRLKGLEYITEMYLLSRCTSLLSTKTSGSLGALIMNEMQFENFEFLDGLVY